jgi:catechol-2,3-dioxygenase
MKDSKTYGLTHLAITVSDVNRTKKFYQQVFDMQIMYDEDGFIQLTTPGCNDIIVFEEKKDRPIGQTGGIAHFGFRLKRPADIEDILHNVIQAGGTIIDTGEFLPGSPYVFFKDLDGYEVEVWYELIR